MNLTTPNMPCRQQIQHLHQRARPLAKLRKRQPEQDPDQDDLQHVSADERLTGAGRDDVHHERHEPRMGGAGGVAGDRRGVQGRRIDVHASAGLQQIHSEQAKQQRKGGHHFEVKQRLRADAAYLLQVAHLCDAGHHTGKDDRRQRHANELDEAIAQRLERRTAVRKEDTHDHAQQDARSAPEATAAPAWSGGLTASLRGSGEQSRLLRQLAHHTNQIGLALKANARQFRHNDVSILHAYSIGKASVGLKQVGIAFIASQPQACCNVQRHLMTAMRDAAAGRPAGDLDHLQGAQILAKPIR